MSLSSASLPSVAFVNSSRSLVKRRRCPSINALSSLSALLFTIPPSSPLPFVRIRHRNGSLRSPITPVLRQPCYPTVLLELEGTRGLIPRAVDASATDQGPRK